MQELLSTIIFDHFSPHDFCNQADYYLHFACNYGLSTRNLRNMKLNGVGIAPTVYCRHPAVNSLAVVLRLQRMHDY